jgi:hypothetical protein
LVRLTDRWVGLSLEWVVTAGARARTAIQAANQTGTVTISQVLDGHVRLDLECLDRVSRNGYVPNLRVSGQVVTFLTQHLGNPIPSPALFNQIGERFRAAVTRFATTNGIPVVRFDKDARRQEVMRPTWMPPRRPGGQGWSRSGWHRSSNGCSVAPRASPRVPERRSSPSPRPTGG